MKKLMSVFALMMVLAAASAMAGEGGDCGGGCEGDGGGGGDGNFYYPYELCLTDSTIVDRSSGKSLGGLNRFSHSYDVAIHSRVGYAFTKRYELKSCFENESADWLELLSSSRYEARWPRLVVNRPAMDY